MWADSCTIEVGGWRMGIRSSRAEIGALVADAFGPYLVDDDAPATWNLRVGGFDGGADERLHLLFRSNRQLARSRRPSRVLRALASNVSSFDDRQMGGRRISSLVVLTGDRRAILLPGEARRHVTKLLPHIEGGGYRVADVPDPRVDLERGLVLLPAPIVTFDAALLDELDERYRANDHASVEPGSYPIAGWAFERKLLPGGQTRSVTVAAMAQTFSTVRDDPQTFLELVASHAASARTVAIRSTDRPGVLASLSELSAA